MSSILETYAEGRMKNCCGRRKFSQTSIGIKGGAKGGGQFIVVFSSLGNKEGPLLGLGETFDRFVAVKGIINAARS